MRNEADGSQSRYRRAGLLPYAAMGRPLLGFSASRLLGVSAVRLRPGESLRLPRHSASSVINGADGSGTATIDGVSLAFDLCDTMAVPTHAAVEIENASAVAAAHLVVVDDAPMQRRLGFHELFDGPWPAVGVALSRSRIS